ncbi:hypothetical protein CEE55_11130 [Stenotrophomonas pavanii]|uniref:Uncharacterized protein n=2 Tax=Lysobacteraceae TaxID=32033 RepID=A0A246KYG2_9GAMM|nr:hypothetical protein STRNTR1_2349 [Stenotrophomonas maltophilia]OWR33598.1 hypothetical protein CEE55_11130 [Stenotrophomonas pavanii]CCH12677.1 hypothetical protein SMD_2134 [Stenotrophomonas maltophilia D457]
MLSACTTTTAAHRLGSVKTVSDHTLQLCFDPQAVPPVAGQQVQLVRRQQFGNPKFPPTFRERPVGTARIDADVAGRCVAATLVEGKARRFDEVYPLSADRKPH